MKNSNVIYAYKRKSTNKIVYVGQTINLPERHKTHTEYDPYNPNTREYNYPLSRGIRKYGKDEYELIILEQDIPKEQLDNREKYWINYYDTYWNGYNQSIGGTFPSRPIYTEEEFDQVVKMLQDESFSYADIMKRTGISMTHIYNINIGARRKRDDLTYPIRPSNTKGTKGLRLTPQQNEEVHKLLTESYLAMHEIANKFNVSTDTISKINQGITKAYHLDNYSYPIRTLSIGKAINKTKLSDQDVEDIRELLITTDMSFVEIGEIFGVSQSTISGINSGVTKSYHSDDITYPVRRIK